MIPDEAGCLALHRKYGSDPKVVAHCKTVEKVATILAGELERRGFSVDAKALSAGALLHDIGRSQVQTVEHGVRGAAILESEGVDSKVVEMVRRHVGAGLSPEEARRLGLPDFDYMPRTLEQRVVCFSDKMVDSDLVRPFDGEVQRFVKKGHDVARLRALKESLRDDLGADPEKIIFDKIKGA